MRMQCVLPVLPLLHLSLPAQQILNARPDPDREDTRAVLAPGLRVLRGTEATQQIAFVRIFLDGRLVPAGSPPDTATTLTGTSGRPPVLIAQCTQTPNGRRRFELFTNCGTVNDFSYHPPWRSKGPGDLFPPRTEKLTMTINFYGYIQWKPIRRQFEAQVDPVGELRYNPPSAGSTNMEEVSFYMQYLKPLPTMRLTTGTYAAQFETVEWAKAVHNEPLCTASGL